MKKIIVISTSLRHGSNSDMLAEKFLEGALSAGNSVEKISLVGKNIQFCKGCMTCQGVGALRCQGRRERHHGQGAEGLCGGLGHSYLLL